MLKKKHEGMHGHGQDLRVDQTIFSQIFQFRGGGPNIGRKRKRRFILRSFFCAFFTLQFENLMVFDVC